MSSISSTHSTPVFDVVIPNHDEESFIARALTLGYKEIVFLTTNPNYVAPSTNKIVVKTAYLLKDISELSPARRRFDYVFAVAERKYFESRADFIIDVESSDRKDSFHYRATSLNQVHAELVKKNGLTLVFNFSALLSNPVSVKGKMSQNALLIKKYRLNYVTFSLATNPNMMRSRNILDSLELVLGL